MINFQKRKLALCVAMISTCGYSQVALSQSDDEIVQEEVLVTGFRGSLQRSQDLKRNAVNARESIVAEDMGKMPDLNLAEAIQRVAGVVIARQGGEGRSISLRGLNPGFTHTTLNGMEVPSSTGGLDSSGGVNRGRQFDYNVFSAELFNRIDVNKSAVANLEEGGIAGSVDLFTMRPLDNPGRKVAVSGQLGYNDLSEETDPRFSAIYTDSNEAETIGWMISGAFTERTVHQDGFGTVRWDNPWEDGCATEPTRCFAGNNTSLSDENLNKLWYPRLPRQDSFHHEQERTGISAAIQFRPTDTLEFGINHVRSEFDSTVDSYNSFAEFRRSGQWGFPHNTAEEVTVSQDGGIDYAVQGRFTGVGLRTESRRQEDTTKFAQTTADLKWNISESLELSGMIGQATSDYQGNVFRANIESLTDDSSTPEEGDGGTDFSFDFTGNANVAAVQYTGFDLTDQSNYYLMGNAQLRQYTVDRTNDTVRLDLKWSINDESTVKVGVMLNDREVDSTQGNRTNELPDIDGLTKVYSYADIGGHGENTDLDFLVLDFDSAIPAHGLGEYAPQAGRGVSTWNIGEETSAVYIDYTLDTELAGHALVANLGVRYVETDVSATGYVDADTSFVETNTYTNSLPSLNLTYGITEDMLLRLNVAQTMTRPDMDSLAPNKRYSDVNTTVSGGNSQLEPLVSDDVNLGWEWYFAEEASIGVAFFTKEIDSFISSPSLPASTLRPEDVAIVAELYPTQPGLTTDNTWVYSTSSNGVGADMDGYEIAYQQPFTFLPGFLSNMGLVANFSHVEATTFVERGGEVVEVPLEGMSENSSNITLYYEVDGFGVRVSQNRRDDYVTDNTGSNHNLAHGTTGPTHTDLNAFYNVNDNITITFEAINMMDEDERLYTTGTDGRMDLVREFNSTGRQFFLGVRATF